MNLESTTGLVASSGAPVPLVGVRVDVTLCGPVAEVAITHRYVNAETTPIEAVYLFPLPPEAALLGVSARVGDRLIEGKVAEREEAFATYDDALADGHGAFLVDQERDDVFRVSVGNLRPGQAVEVCMRYAQLVRLEGAALRLQVPTVVAPRYVPASGLVGLVGETDDALLNPERRDAVPYGLTLMVDARLPQGLKRVESPSHPISVEHTPEGVRVSLARPDVPLDRDLVVLLEPISAQAPQSMVALDARGRRHVLVAFQPDDAALEGAAPTGVEVLFLLDCSGSMNGSSIEQARRALALCIRTLREGDRFDVVCFGHTHVPMWGAARDMNEANLQEASTWLASRGANLGGTEILPALTSLLTRPLDPSRTRQVVLLTDGQVSNEAEVIALAARYAGQARVFALGIGDGVGEALVRGVARVSRGEAELIGSGERIEPKVLRQFSRLRQPALADVSVDFGDAMVSLSPAVLPPVFADDRLVVYGLLEAGHSTEARLSAGGRSWTAPLDLETPVRTSAVGALWAKARLLELEDAGEGRRGSAQKRVSSGERAKERVLALALDYQLASSATSWVLVETRGATERTVTSAALRTVPLAHNATTPAFAKATQSMPLSSFAVSRVDMALEPGGARRREAPKGAAKRSAPPSPAPAGAPAPSLVSRTMSALRDALGGSSRGLMETSAPPPPAAEPSAPRSWPAAEEAPSAPDAGDLYEVLIAQRANGAFDASPAVRLALGDAYAGLLAAAPEEHDVSVEVRVTQAVLHWLDTAQAARRDEWRGAAEKATQWLATQNTAPQARVLAWFTGA